MSFNKNIFKKSSRKIHVNFSCNVKNDCPYIFFSTSVKYTNNTSVRIGDSEPWEAWMFLFCRNWHLPPGRNEASIWRQPLREGFPTSNGRYRQRYRLQTCIQQCSLMQRHLDKFPLPIDEKIYTVVNKYQYFTWFYCITCTTLTRSSRTITFLKYSEVKQSNLKED